jgi:hypothetical protein
MEAAGLRENFTGRRGQLSEQGGHPGECRRSKSANFYREQQQKLVLFDHLTGAQQK